MIDYFHPNAHIENIQYIKEHFVLQNHPQLRDLMAYQLLTVYSSPELLNFKWNLRTDHSRFCIGPMNSKPGFEQLLNCLKSSSCFDLTCNTHFSDKKAFPSLMLSFLQQVTPLPSGFFYNFYSSGTSFIPEQSAVYGYRNGQSYCGNMIQTGKEMHPGLWSAPKPAIQCYFRGITPPVLEKCRDIVHKLDSLSRKNKVIISPGCFSMSVDALTLHNNQELSDYIILAEELRDIAENQSDSAEFYFRTDFVEIFQDDPVFLKVLPQADGTFQTQISEI